MGWKSAIIINSFMVESLNQKRSWHPNNDGRFFEIAMHLKPNQIIEQNFTGKR